MATDPGQIMPTAGQIGLFKSILQALSKPAYALIFGAILLNYLFCIAILVRSSGSELLIGGSLVVMIASTVIAFLTVNSVGRQDSVARSAVESEKLITAKDAEISHLKLELAGADRRDVNIGDLAMAEVLSKSIDNVRNATGRQNEVFKEEIRYRLGLLKKETEDWAQGDLITDGANYERILQRFYRDARQSVFATSNEDYLPFWHEPGSKGILQAHAEAHKKHGSLVTRVFVFSSFSHITDENLAIILDHCAPNHITGKIFIFDESPGKAFGSALFKDFVIIDRGLPGQAVGVTSSFETGSMAAKWMVEPDIEIEHAADFIKQYWNDLEDVRERRERAKG